MRDTCAVGLPFDKMFCYVSPYDYTLVGTMDSL